MKKYFTSLLSAMPFFQRQTRSIGSKLTNPSSFLIEELVNVPFKKFKVIDNYVGFSPFDMKALSLLIKQYRPKICLEIGTFLGTGSTTVFYSLGAELTCIDHWKGNTHDCFMQGTCAHYDLFQMCKNNIKKYDRKGSIQLLNKESIEASKSVQDNTCDLIFIDAGHTYREVKKDIEAWVNKVKPGGIICGHDCEGIRKDFPDIDFSDASLEKLDFDKHYQCHPGVIRAVEEFFEQQGCLFIKKPLTVQYPKTKKSATGVSSVWYYQMPHNLNPT